MTSFLKTSAEHPIILLSLLANLSIGFWAHRKSKSNSFEDYALASRSLPTGVLTITLLATFIASGQLSKIDRFYAFGLMHAIPSVVAIISFVLIGTFIAPFLVYFNKSVTTGGLMGLFYGKQAQVSAGILGIFVSLLITSSQISTLGSISKALLHVDFSVAVLVAGTLVVAYSIWGGMRAVSYTDVLQMITVLLLFSWLTQKAVYKVGGLTALFKKLSNYPDKVAVVSHPKFYFKLKVAAFWGLPFSYILGPPMIQRMLIIQDKKEVRKMWYTSAFLLLLMTFGIVLIGFAGFVGRKEFGLTKAHNVLAHIIESLFEKQTLIQDLIYIGIISILLSTIDSYLHTIGITLVEDLIVPFKSWRGSALLTESQKVKYTKIGTALIGIFSILIALQVEDNLRSIAAKLSSPANLIYAAIITPLIFGIIGIKTDKFSWVSFSMAYFGSMLIAWGLGWKRDIPSHHAHYDYFLLAMCTATLTYFITHIYVNGGIVTLKRSEQTITEQLWIPTWKGVVAYLKSWLLAPFQLHILASRKIVTYPTHSLSFSMLIFALYNFSSVMIGGGNDLGLANFMAGIHLIGITLCVGLMLEGIWPDRLKPYFALYWFFALFYCLSFGSTLAFLRTHGDTIAVGKLIANFMLLAFLVDSTSFITLTCLGSGLAMVSWYVVCSSIPSDLLDSVGLIGGYLFSILLVAVLLFKSSKEQYASQRLSWNRTASSALGHDLRTTVGMLGGAGNALSNAFKIGKSKINEQGEEGYWIPKRQATFFEHFSAQMIARGKMAEKEIQGFSSFIKGQVLGVFDQKKTSMRAAAEEAIRKLAQKMPKVKMTVLGKKDLNPKVLSGIFSNVFSNLLWNAATHGKASEIEVRIDDVKRTVTVWDNGEGVPSDILPRIFDLNFTTGDKKQKNSGVGLAFVKMVISASSGKISCHARHGDKGSFTEFIMEFPEV